jgi:hypothetical protein
MRADEGSKAEPTMREMGHRFFVTKMIDEGKMTESGGSSRSLRRVDLNEGRVGEGWRRPISATLEQHPSLEES